MCAYGTYALRVGLTGVPGWEYSGEGPVGDVGSKFRGNVAAVRGRLPGPPVSTLGSNRLEEYGLGGGGPLPPVEGLSRSS